MVADYIEARFNFFDGLCEVSGAAPISDTLSSYCSDALRLKGLHNVWNFMFSSSGTLTDLLSWKCCHMIANKDIIVNVFVRLIRNFGAHSPMMRGLITQQLGVVKLRIIGLIELQQFEWAYT